MIYVISDGKDVRSKASVREVIRFLQGNQETVYGTMVGDAATWGIGYLDRVHLPLIPAENVLPRYANATGGVLEAQFSAEGMERSFATIAKEIRTQYTLGLLQPSADDRRTLSHAGCARGAAEPGCEGAVWLLPDGYDAVMTCGRTGERRGHGCAEPGIGSDLGHQRFCGRHCGAAAAFAGGGDACRIR